MKGRCEGESFPRGRSGLFFDRHLAMKLVGKYVDKAGSVGVVSPHLHNFGNLTQDCLGLRKTSA